MADRSEHSIAELTTDLAELDATMASLRAQKEEIVAELRRLQRIRDDITDPLERKQAVERATNPTTVIGL